MGLSFHETMQGALQPVSGETMAVDFTVKAEATRLLLFLRDGRARLTGVIHAAPLAHAAPLEGTLTIRALPAQGRYIQYLFRFPADDGGEIELSGRKDLTLRHPLASTARMRTELRRDGVLLASGELRFLYDDLVSFLASASIDGALREVRLAAPSDDGLIPATVYGPADRARLAAFADALIEPGERVPAADDETVSQAEAIVACMPAGTSSALAASLRALDAVAIARYARPFTALDRRARVALLAALDGGSGGDGLGGLASPHQLLHLAAMPIRTAHFGRRDYLDALGVPPPAPPTLEPDPAWTAAIVTPEQLASEERVDCDVVVIGTGAGGAAVAARLAERGLAVALVEEGPYLGRRDYAGAPFDRMRRLWRKAGMTFSIGNPPVSLPQGRLVGGTTAINSGTCFRAPERVFADWRRDAGLGSEFAEEGMARWYTEVERELQVQTAETHHLGVVAGVVQRGADAMGLGNGPLPRNAPGCDAQGACIFGCPSGAKRSSDVSWVPRAMRAGAALYAGLPVTRLLRRGRRVEVVEARAVDRDGVAKRVRFHARTVVVACGAIGSPHLLLREGFDLPMLGRNLSVHPEVGMWVRMNEAVSPWAAIPQSYGIHGLEEEGLKFEGYFMPPDLSAGTAPLFGRELTRWMDDFHRTAQFGFLAKDPGNGSVHRGPDGAPVVRYDLDLVTHGRLQRGAAILAEVLLRGGGVEVMPNIRHQPTITNIEGARRLGEARLRRIDWNLLGSHPLGTCRIGADARVAVCDPEHRVFGTDNLYVVDGSSVPTSLGVNPQLTIMALALRAADAIV